MLAWGLPGYHGGEEVALSPAQMKDMTLTVSPGDLIRVCVSLQTGHYPHFTDKETEAQGSAWKDPQTQLLLIGKLEGLVLTQRKVGPGPLL